jgi:hypothetical protein
MHCIYDKVIFLILSCLEFETKFTTNHDGKAEGIEEEVNKAKYNIND